MPNFPEPITPDFVPVYQIQRTDPVDAGAAGEGPSNLPIKNLVERTAYLKKEVEDLDTTLGGVVIGSTVQGYDPDLQAIAALTTTGLIDRTGAGTATTRATGATGLAVLASADAPTARAAIGASDFNPAVPGPIGGTTPNNIFASAVSTSNILFPSPLLFSTSAGLATSITSANEIKTVRIPGTYNFDGLYLSNARANGGAKIELISHANSTQSQAWQIVHESDNAQIGSLTFKFADSSDSYSGLSYSNIARFRDGRFLIGYEHSNGLSPLQVNGQIFATSSTIATSDARYKTNITELTGALNLINQLNPVQFEWLEHPVHQFDRSSPTLGFLAQEIQVALQDEPWLNSLIKVNQVIIPATDSEPEKTENFLGIAEGNLIALLTKAVQELTARVNVLETQIASQP